MTEIYRKRNVCLIDKEKTQLEIEDGTTNYAIEIEEKQNDQIPLEMLGIVRAVRKYALQTSALGMGIGIDELTKIEEIIRNLQPHENGLQVILHHVEQRQKVLKETFRQAYKM
jgi:hypothetical protein